MVINRINEYKFNNKSDLYDLAFKNIDNMNSNISTYNKLVILCSDEKRKNYYFQDIIDLGQLARFNNTHKLRVNKNIYLVPLKNINTFLYSFENSTNSEIRNNYSNITKYEEIPKYSWNIGYDGNKYLLHSEEDNQVYSFIEQDNSNDLIKVEFNLDKKIESINSKNNKIIDFIDAKEGFSSFAFTEKGDLLLLDDKNRNKYKWLNEKEQTNIEYPINFQNIKIINLSANYNVCYAIGQNGNLYK